MALHQPLEPPGRCYIQAAVLAEGGSYELCILSHHHSGEVEATLCHQFSLLGQSMLR